MLSNQKAVNDISNIIMRKMNAMLKKIHIVV